MKKQLKLFIVTTAIALLLSSINAQTVNLDASITIKSNLTLQTQQPLSFGEITKPTQDIMVRLQEDDSLTDDTNNIILNANASTGKYQLIGEPNASISVSVDTVGTLSGDTGDLNVTYSIKNAPTVLNAQGQAIIVVVGAVSIP